LRKRFVLAAPAVLVVALVAVVQLPASASHSPAHPCDLIAATNGSDANAGIDAAQPLRTVQELVERLGPGQTGCLRGTAAAEPFSEDVAIHDKNPSGGSESDRITLMSHPGEVAKLRGRIEIEDSANRVTLTRLVLVGESGGAAARLDGNDLVVADSNITHRTGACVSVGALQSSPDVNVRAERVRLLRNRIHDCFSDAIKLSRTRYATVLGNLVYDSGGHGVKLSQDADGTYVYRNILDRNGQGVVFFGVDGSRFADSNFVDSNIVSRSTAGMNIGYSQMPGSGGNFVSQTCVYSPTDSGGGVQTDPLPRGYQVWSPPLPIGDPGYRDRAQKDFRPAGPGDPCFRHSGDVATIVDIGGGPTDEQASASNPRPNILVILTDDQRAEGTLTQETMPKTVNRLQKPGVDFRNAFVTTPLCCPSRASIMTGQYTHNHEVTGAVFGENMRFDSSLQAYLQQHDEHPYRTGLFGKFLNNWNLDKDPEYWDDWSIMNGDYCPFLVNERGSRNRYPPLDPVTGGPQRNPDGTLAECKADEIGKTALGPYATHHIRDRAVGFLEDGEASEATDAKPWLLYVAPTAPHALFTPEADYAESVFSPYEWNPATFEDSSDKPPWVGSSPANPTQIFGDGTSTGRRVHQLRTLRSVDDMVGTLLDELEQKGEQDTLILFLGDNGYLWGEHGLTAKGLPYDPAVRVPLLMKYPPVTTPGSTDDRIVANIDLMPTALEAAGVSPGAGDPPLDGQSLIGNATPRQRIHTEYYRHNDADTTWAATRAPGDYLYVERYAGDGETVVVREFYDLATDPFELTNLYGPDGQPDEPGEPNPDDLGTPQYSVAQLHERLLRDRLCEGAACPPGPGAGTVDAKPPRTIVTAPRLGTTVCCRVKLKAYATDNIGVDRVEFRVDGNLVGTDSAEPHGAVWDSAAYAAGPHMVEAIAVDNAGNRTLAGSAGSSTTVNLDKNGFDIQIDDGGVPRTNCNTFPSPCNVGTVNPGDTIAYSFPSAVSPASLLPGWDGSEPAVCTGDPPPLGCVTVGIRADSQVDDADNDTLGIYSDVAATSRIAALGDVDLGDYAYVRFDTNNPFRVWPNSPMKVSPDGRTVTVTVGPGTGPPDGGPVGTAKWTNPACGCQVWESIDGADADEDREF
jgi:arylsulfatase A-like enzyme